MQSKSRLASCSAKLALAAVLLLGAGALVGYNLAKVTHDDVPKLRAGCSCNSSARALDGDGVADGHRDVGAVSIYTMALSESDQLVENHSRLVAAEDQNSSSNGASAYVCDERHGLWLDTYEDGSWATGIYVDGEMEGEWKVYWPQGGLKRRGVFANGHQHGLSTEWFESGLRAREEEFFYGMRHGVERRWYPNGELESLAHFHYSVEHGAFDSFYKGGQRKVSGAYFYGLKAGRWVEWGESGCVIQDVYYVCNRLEGYCRFYLEDGSVDLELTGIYADGELRH